MYAIIQHILKSSNKDKIRHLKNFVSVFFILENWWVYYLDFFYYIKKSPIVFKLRNGRIFLGLPTNWDGIVINEIWGIKNDYVPNILSINKNDIVVDIGAHKGYFSVYASTKTKKGTIYSFEPFPSNYELLKKNLKINQCKNVKAFKIGIAGTKGKKKLFLGKDDSKSGYSILKTKYNNYGNCDVITISVLRLQDIFTLHKINHIDFLKLDCEGAEYEIFMSTPKKIFQKIKQISMEYHRVNNFNAKMLKKLFEQNGFKVILNEVRPEIGMLYAIKK